MHHRSSIAVLASFAALLMTVVGAAAFDESKYPDLKGNWNRVGAPRWVQADDKAPLTPNIRRSSNGTRRIKRPADTAGSRPGCACRPACRGS